MKNQYRINCKKHERATLSVSVDRRVERAMRSFCHEKGYMMSRIAEILFIEWLGKNGKSIVEAE